MRVLSARGSELEREFPFGVVRQLFEPRRWPARRVRAAAAAAAGAVFASADDAAAEAGDACFAALHGLYWLALNLAASQPLLLAVDDLHWVRPPVAALPRLPRCGALEGMPILVAATLRSAEPGTDPALLGRDRPRPGHRRRCAPAR